MNKTIIFLICSFLSFGIHAQSIIGAWEHYHTSAENENLRSVFIVSDKYQVLTTYNADSGAFIATKGGSWVMEGDSITETVEFDSKNPETVGSELSYKVFLNDSTLKIAEGDIKMKRIDDGTPGALHGAWLMSGRTVDAKKQVRDTDTPRKTMKILSGTRFQWIAYNTETKQFMATGGGSYTTENGTYTENIEFFSKDNTKVGLQLKFDYKLKNSDWHHSGFSTKGNPIDEVWSKRK